MRGRGVKLTTDIHLAPKLRMRGAILLLPPPNLLSYSSQELSLYFYQDRDGSSYVVLYTTNVSLDLGIGCEFCKSSFHETAYVLQET